MATESITGNGISMDSGIKANGILSFQELQQLIYNSEGSDISRILIEECTMIIECASCRELFRNVGRFVKHKLEDCQRRAKDFAVPADSNTKSQNVGDPRTNSTPAVRPERIRGNSNAVYQHASSTSESNSFGTIACAMLQAASRIDNQADFATDLDDNDVCSPPRPSSFGPVADSSETPDRAAHGDDCEDESVNEVLEADIGHDDNVGKEAEEFQIDDGNNRKSDNRNTTGVQITCGSIGSAVTASALTRSHHDRRLCDLGRLFCLVCNTSFASSKSLQQHMVTSHPVKKIFYEGPLCPEAYMHNSHSMTREDINEFAGRLKKKVPSGGFDASASTASYMASPAGIRSNVAMPAHLAGSTLYTPADCRAAAVAIGEAGYEPVPKRKKLDSPRCSNCAKTFGSVQLLLKHEESCTHGSGKAVAETLLMLSEVRHPTASGRHSRRQRKTSRLPVGELDEDASDYSDCISSAADNAGGQHVSAPSVVPFEFASSPSTPNTTAAGRHSRRQRKPSRLHLGELDEDASDYSDCISSAAEYAGGQHVSAPSVVPFEFASSPSTPNTMKENSALKSESGLQTMPVDSQERSRRNRNSAERAALVSELDGIADVTTLLCLPCGKQFSTRFNLLRHAKRHLPARLYKCAKCDFSNPERAACLDHVRQCHVADGSIPLSELEAFVVDSQDGATAQLSSSPRANDLPAVAPCHSGDAMTVDSKGTFSVVNTSTTEEASGDSEN